MQSLVPDIGVALTNFAAQVSCRRLPPLRAAVVSGRVGQAVLRPADAGSGRAG
jgi:hypothetical protein